MGGILPFVDVVVGNEEDCDDVLGIREHSPLLIVMTRYFAFCC